MAVNQLVTEVMKLAVNMYAISYYNLNEINYRIPSTQNLRYNVALQREYI